MPKTIPTKEWQVLSKTILSTSIPDSQKIKIFPRYHVNDCHEANGDTLLIEACRPHHANPAIVRFLLAQGADCKAVNKDGETALFIAAHYNLEITMLLVSAGSDVNHRPTGKFEYTPLQAATSNGFKEIVNYLMEHKADPNLPSRTLGTTPLFCAAQDQKLAPLIKPLCRQHGATVDIRTARGETPLYAAVELRIPAAVEALLECKANPDAETKDNVAPLYNLVCQVQAQYDETIERIVLLLLGCGAQINRLNKLGLTALFIASDNGNIKLVRLLLKHQADPNIKINVPANVNYNQGLPHDAKTTLKPTNPAYCVTTTLHMVAIHNHVHVTAALLKAKANPNQPDEFGVYPLHIACARGHVEVARKLLDAHANPDCTLSCFTNVTPLHLAVVGQYTKVIKLLLTKKINKHARDAFGHTPLHATARRGDLYHTQILVEAGFYVNAEGNDGATPLFFAAQEGHEAVVKYLLDSGADPDILRNDGASALFMAHKFQHVGVVNLLMRFYYQKKFSSSQQIINFKIAFEIVLGGKNIAKYEPVFAESKAVDAKETAAPAVVKKVPSAAAALEPYVPPAEPSAQSAYAFLLSRGFSKTQIQAMRAQNKKNMEAHASRDQKDDAVMDEKAGMVTWWDGRIGMCTPGVSAIESSTNCFFYLDTQSLRDQGCGDDDLQIFQALIPKFCAGEHEQGIKTLSHPPEIDVALGDQMQRVTLKFELKHMKGKSRVLCFSTLASDGRCTLVVGAVYVEEGLHKTKDVQTLPKQVTVHLPRKHEDHIAGVTELLKQFGLLQPAKPEKPEINPCQHILEYCSWSAAPGSTA